MTGILIKRGNSDTDIDRWKTMWRHRLKMPIYNLRRGVSEKTPTLLQLDLRLSTSRILRKFLLFKSHSLWYFVMATLENKCNFLDFLNCYNFPNITRHWKFEIYPKLHVICKALNLLAFSVPPRSPINMTIWFFPVYLLLWYERLHIS